MEAGSRHSASVRKRGKEGIAHGPRWLVLGGMVGAVLAGGAAAAEPPRVGVNAGAPIWNGNILLNDALAADIAGAGCRAVRVNFRLDGNSSWNGAHLARYDTIIQTARSHHLQVLGLICYEAVAGGQAQWNENYDTTGMNPYIAEFAATAAQLITRYADQIRLFELWNEPDCWAVPPDTNPLEPGCFYIWPRNYARLLAETYLACVAAGGPEFFSAHEIALATGGLFAHDIGGSYSPSMTTYMNQVYEQTAVWDAFEAAAGRRYPWDLFGYHFYLNQGEPVSTAELASYFENVRFWKAWYGDGSTILVTEFGWNTQSVSPALQATNLRDTYDWFRTQGDIRTGYWYQWSDGDGGWGLNYGVGNPKPAYHEFAAQCALAPAPVADFEAAPTLGPAPLPVDFANLCTGLIDTYAWDFGDGATSAEANPGHVYTAPGCYSVTLTVAGPGGGDACACTGCITVGGAVDFDGDLDTDLHDYAYLERCASGTGNTTPPAGCTCGSATLQAAEASHEFAVGIGALSRTISAADLLHGQVGALEAGGFHDATPGGEAGGLADLTDGVAGSAVEAVLADYARPALQVRYDLAPPRDLAEIRVFAAAADGRVFQNYDVAVSTGGDPGFTTLLGDVRTGPFGAVNNGAYGAALTTVRGAGEGPIAVNVDALRVTCYDVSMISPAGVFRDEWDAGEPGDGDGQPRAYMAPIIKEIDVLGYGGPPLLTNCADLDGDRDADAADLAVLAVSLGGPAH